MPQKTKQRTLHKDLTNPALDLLWELYKEYAIPAFVLNKNNKIIKYNLAIARLSGYSAKEMPDLNTWLKIIYPNKNYRNEVIKDIIRYAKVKSYPNSKEYIITRKDGAKRRVELSLFQLPERGGAREFILVQANDITQRKTLEEELRLQKEKYQSSINSLPIGTFSLIIDDRRNIRFEEVNQSFLNIFEASSLTEFNRSTLKRSLLANGIRQEELIKEIDKKGYLKEVEVQLFTLKGNRIWTSVSATKSRILSPAGYIYYDGIIQDITQRKNLEANIKESEERMRSIIASLEDNIFILNKDGIFIDYRPGKQEELYVKPEQFLGRTYKQVLPKEVARKMTPLLKKVFATGEPRQFDYALDISGRTEWFKAKISLFKDVNDNKSGFTVVTSNIAKNKQAEVLLSKQHKLSLYLSEISDLSAAINKVLETVTSFEGLDSGGFYLFDPIKDHLHLVASKGLGLEFIRITQDLGPDTPQCKKVKRGKVIYADYEGLGVQLDRIRKKEGLLAMIALPICYRHKVIACLNVASHSHNIKDLPNNTRKALEAIAYQLGGIITRLRTEEKLQESEKDYRTLFETMFNGFALHEIIMDAQGKPCDYRFLKVNKEFEKLTGLKKEKIIGRTVRKVLPNIESTWIDTYGRVALSGKSISYESYAQDLKKYYKVHAFSPKKYQFATIFIDITESTLLNRELSRKNKELEDMVRVVSHDLRSPLINIKGFSEELKLTIAELSRTCKSQEVPPDVLKIVQPLLFKDIPNSLDFIRNSTAKMELLISGLLKLSRLEQAGFRPEKINMNKLIKEVLANFGFIINNKKIKVITTDLPDCCGDKDLINQVFSNLIDNAIKYLDPDRGGVLKISGKLKGGVAVYCVEDNGIGIAPEHQQDLFKIFHRLDPQKGVGEGLGLNIASRIIEKHGGKIWVDSDLGKGCKFFISLGV